MNRKVGGGKVGLWQRKTMEEIEKRGTIEEESSQWPS